MSCLEGSDHSRFSFLGNSLRETLEFDSEVNRNQTSFHECRSLERQINKLASWECSQEAFFILTFHDILDLNKSFLENYDRVEFGAGRIMEFSRT